MTKNNTVESIPEVTETPEVTKITFDQTVYDGLLVTHKTISGVIRYLSSTGMSRGDIAKTTNKRYQHVRNVLITPLKKA